jgi:hypothetical protein
MLGGVGLSIREVWHKGWVTDVNFAVFGTQRKEVRRDRSKCPGRRLAGSVSV